MFDPNFLIFGGGLATILSPIWFPVIKKQLTLRAKEVVLYDPDQEDYYYDDGEDQEDYIDADVEEIPEQRQVKAGKQPAALLKSPKQTENQANSTKDVVPVLPEQQSIPLQPGVSILEGRNVKLLEMYHQNGVAFRRQVIGFLCDGLQLAYENGGRITFAIFTDAKDPYACSKGNWDDLYAAGGLFWKAGIIGTGVENKNTIFADPNAQYARSIPYENGETGTFVDGSVPMLNEWLANEENWKSIPVILNRKKNK